MTDCYAFPTLFMQFDLNGLYDPNDCIRTFSNHPHSLLEPADTGSGSTYTQTTRYLDSHSNLQSRIQSCVDRYQEKLGLNKLQITNSWINYSTKGTRTKVHRHEGSVISGAFYPKIVGDNAGSLRLHSPLKVYHTYFMFENENELNTYHIDCPSEQGILYLFPSYIEHEALPTQAEHRYVLSFNTDYKLIGKRSV